KDLHRAKAAEESRYRQQGQDAEKDEATSFDHLIFRAQPSDVKTKHKDEAYRRKDANEDVQMRPGLRDQVHIGPPRTLSSRPPASSMGRVVGTFQFFVDRWPVCNPSRIRAVHQNGRRPTSSAPLSLEAIRRCRRFNRIVPRTVLSQLTHHRCARHAKGWPSRRLE